MDLCVCDGCITLPADVATILACNNSGQPTLLRDQWFSFHANGPGIQCDTPWNYTDELGPVVTYKDPSGPVKLIAEVENSKDSSCTNLRVYGWDGDGKRIYTPGPSGVLEDGFFVPSIFGFSAPNPDAPLIARIDRVQKSLTNGFVRLIAINEDGTTNTTIGHYLPWETVPSYRRIKVPNRSWIRIKYRRKDIEVRSKADWINIDNREALLLLLKAVKFRLNNQFDQARASESEGMRLLSNEAAALRVPALDGPQIVFNEGIPAGQFDTLFF